MCECSFMNQICTNIVIISRVELPNKIARNHHGRKEGGVWGEKVKSKLCITIADKHCKLAALRSLCSSPC